jgi:hypothetical protein
MAGSLRTEQLGVAKYQRVVDPNAGNIDIVATYGVPCRWITLGVAGTLVVTGTDGVNVTLPSMPQGHVHLCSYNALVASGTTCTSAILPNVLFLFGLLPEAVQLIRLVVKAVKAGDAESAKLAAERAAIVQAFRLAQIEKRRKR